MSRMGSAVCTSRNGHAADILRVPWRRRAHTLPQLFFATRAENYVLIRGATSSFMGMFSGLSFSSIFLAACSWASSEPA